MSNPKQNRNTEVKQLTELLKKYDLRVTEAALYEIGISIVVRIGFSVKTTWGEIQFEEDCWDRTTLPTGCIKYTAKTPRTTSGECLVRTITSDGTSVDRLYSPGAEVIICGDTAHFPPANRRFGAV